MLPYPLPAAAAVGEHGGHGLVVGSSFPPGVHCALLALVHFALVLLGGGLGAQRGEEVPRPLRIVRRPPPRIRWRRYESMSSS